MCVYACVQACKHAYICMCVYVGEYYKLMKLCLLSSVPHDIYLLEAS